MLVTSVYCFSSWLRSEPAILRDRLFHYGRDPGSIQIQTHVVRFARTRVFRPSKPAGKFPFQLHIDMRSARRPFSRGHSATPNHSITIGPISILPRLTRLAGTVYQ